MSLHSNTNCLSKRVVVATDKFKGSVTAAEAAAALARGLRSRSSAIDVVEYPVADGGEGSVDMVLRYGFRAVSCEVPGPFGEAVTAVYAECDRTAVIEMASAAGLALVAESSQDDVSAGSASTYGVGRIILHAVNRGAQRILLAVGGSATTDGGAGLAVALGARVLDASGRDVANGGMGLLEAEVIDLTGLEARLDGIEFFVACDVDNPLTGPNGAAAVYAPQKGASPGTVAALSRALEQWAAVVARTVGHDTRELAGSGAAGGLAFGAAGLLGARLMPGIDLMLELGDFDNIVKYADLVIVGEGSLDAQSLRGKGPVGVAARARAAGAKVVAVVGRSLLTTDEARGAGLRAVYALSEIEPNEVRSMTDAAELLEQTAGRIADEWLVHGTST